MKVIQFYQPKSEAKIVFKDDLDESFLTENTTYPMKLTGILAVCHKVFVIAYSKIEAIQAFLGWLILIIPFFNSHEDVRHLRGK